MLMESTQTVCDYAWWMFFNSHNVGINQVEPIIRAVLRLAEIECDKLPKHTAISEMLESRTLSQIQLTHTLTESDYNTPHSDGTTKFGHIYCGYQISTAERSLTLGLQVCAQTVCVCVCVCVCVQCCYCNITYHRRRNRGGQGGHGPPTFSRLTHPLLPYAKQKH